MIKMRRRQFTRALAGLASAGLASTNPTQADPETDGLTPHGSITDVPGIKVGHYTDSRRPTGCTAILFENQATAGVDYDGSSVGSHEGVLLQPISPVEAIHGLFLTGGGAFGLLAVAGVVQYLEEHKIGYHDGKPDVVLPIVVGSSIYDLEVGDARIRPDAEAAYKACQAASSSPVMEGNVGAGAGATVGKMLQGYGGMKGGLGTASFHVGDVVIGALAVVNAFGDIIDRRTAKIIAGARSKTGKGFANIVATMKGLRGSNHQASAQFYDPVMRATNLVVVATNADFNKKEMTKIAMMGTIGAGRVINPYHTTGDGDSTFGLSTNRLKTSLSVSVIGSLAAEVVSEAIIRAIKAAESIEGWPAYRDYTVG